MEVGTERDCGFTTFCARSQPSNLATAFRKAEHDHLEATRTAASVAPLVSDDEGTGAENEAAVDGEAAGTHDGTTAAHFETTGFDVETSGLNGCRPSSLEERALARRRFFGTPCISQNLPHTLRRVRGQSCVQAHDDDDDDHHHHHSDTSSNANANHRCTYQKLPTHLNLEDILPSRCRP